MIRLHFDKVMALLVTAVLILMIAIHQFHQSFQCPVGRQNKEVGIRKALGADRGALIFQFMGESILLSVIAFLFALGLLELFTPLFTSIAELQIIFVSIYQPGTLAGYFLHSNSCGSSFRWLPDCFYVSRAATFFF